MGDSVMKLAFVQHSKVISVNDYSEQTVPSNHLVNVTDMNPQPEAGWPLFEGDIVQPYILDRVQWFKRLLPFYSDYEAAFNADKMVRAYTKMWELEPAMNLRRVETMTMIADLAARIISTTPATTLTAEILTAYGTVAEQYKR